MAHLHLNIEGQGTPTSFTVFLLAAIKGMRTSISAINTNEDHGAIRC